MSLHNEQINFPSLTCDDRLLWDTWMSMFHFPTLTIADELGLFPLLEKSPATAAEVGKSLGLGNRSTEALLGVITSLGYLVQHSGKFYITDVSRNFLLPNSPYYWGGILHLMRTTSLSHSSLLEALQNDKSTVYEDQDIWETHQIDAEQAKAFTRHMHSQTMSPALRAAKTGHFADVKRLVDVGGGSGAFCFALAEHYPEIRCTVLELPVVCKIAQEYISSAKLEEQINTLEADFFKDPFPEGYDAILFSNIFHDWGREKCLLLAQRSFEALPKGGHIYIHEILLSDTKDSPLVATSFSMCMVWMAEGKQFTDDELHRLLTECGFEDILVTPTSGYYSLVSGRKP